MVKVCLMKTLLLFLTLSFSAAIAKDHWSDDPKIHAQQDIDWKVVVHVWPEIEVEGSAMRTEMQRILGQIGELQKDNPKLYSHVARMAWQNIGTPKPAPVEQAVPAAAPAAPAKSSTPVFPVPVQPTVDPVVEELRKMQRQQFQEAERRRLEEMRREQQQRFDRLNKK